MSVCPPTWCDLANFQVICETNRAVHTWFGHIGSHGRGITRCCWPACSVCEARTTFECQGPVWLTQGRWNHIAIVKVLVQLIGSTELVPSRLREPIKAQHCRFCGLFHLSSQVVVPLDIVSQPGPRHTFTVTTLSTTQYPSTPPTQLYLAVR